MSGKRWSITPPPGLGMVLTWLGGGACLALMVLPAYLAILLAIALALPLLAFPPLILWPGQFILAENTQGRPSPYQNLAGLWLFPPVGTAYSLWQADIQLVFTVMPVVGGLGLGLLFAAVAGLLDPRSRNAFLGLLFVAGSVWGWSMLMFVNLELDPTAGPIRPAFVTEQLTGSHHALEVSLQDQSLTGLRFYVDRETYRRLPAGTPICVEDNPGLLGWRTLWLVGCTGPLTDLKPDPVE